MLAYAKLVKFSHTVFALPFALIGFVLAWSSGEQDFSCMLFIYVLLALVFARNAAMGFNRYIDRDIDALNPRTSSREIPSGVISPKKALTFTILNASAFMIVAYFINTTCLYLSPLALMVILGYSLTKRFTWLCHFVLGLALSIAPSAAYLALDPSSIPLHILILSLVVLLWVSGFDILYSLSDEDFDKKQGLCSIPARFGKVKAFWISSFLHAIIPFLLVWFYFEAQLSSFYILGASIFSLLLLVQHLLISPHDLKRLNAAFFTTNGLASILFALFTIIDSLG